MVAVSVKNETTFSYFYSRHSYNLRDRDHKNAKAITERNKKFG